tara:strand:+ start:360 stop:1367 length:1008 start_codon:yes stop_codon:yes gene_type:complete
MTKHLTLLLFIGLALGRTTVAIFDFENNGLEPYEVRQLSTRLESELVIVNKYNVVERSKIDEILKEQKLQMSGCVEECLIEIGNMVGAKKVILGSVGIMGRNYTSSARLVNAETGEILKSANYDTQSLGDLLSFGMKYMAGTLCGLNIALPKNKISKKNTLDERQKKIARRELEDYAAERIYSKTLDEALNDIQDEIDAEKGRQMDGEYKTIRFNEIYIDEKDFSYFREDFFGRKATVSFAVFHGSKCIYHHDTNKKSGLYKMEHIMSLILRPFQKSWGFKIIIGEGIIKDSSGFLGVSSGKPYIIKGNIEEDDYSWIFQKAKWEFGKNSYILLN